MITEMTAGLLARGEAASTTEEQEPGDEHGPLPLEVAAPTTPGRHAIDNL